MFQAGENRQFGRRGREGGQQLEHEDVPEERQAGVQADLANIAARVPLPLQHFEGKPRQPGRHQGRSQPEQEAVRVRRH